MDRNQRALERNLHELGRAILERKAMVGMERAKSYHAVDFFRLAYDALFNDMIAHAIKVFDQNKNSETFWSIYDREKTTIDQYLKDNNCGINMLHEVTGKLKIIRDKTHFHIDKKGVLKPSDVWEKESITGKELAKAIDITWEVLKYIYRIKKGEDFCFPNYSGTDITAIIKVARKEGLI